MPAMDGDPVAQCHEITPAEGPVLRLIAQGKRDAEIEAEWGMTAAAVQSIVRRFQDRTGLHGRLLAVWCREHLPCCSSIAK